MQKHLAQFFNVYLRKYCVFVMCIFLAIVIYFSAICPNFTLSLTGSVKSLKKILVWNSPHRIETAAFGTGHEVFHIAECPINDCTVSANNTQLWSDMMKSNFELLKTFDAVIFHIHELRFSPSVSSDYQRPLNQRFVLLTQESPQSMSNFHPEHYNDFFNWTMSYRRDSDIQLLYGRIVPSLLTHSQRNIGLTSPGRKKTKKVVWMASHCPTFSKREEYVKALQDHIQVDVYGGCGTLKCARNDTHWLSDPECYVKLASEYKFYLSFENSVCQDYVTEKFFNILQHDMVPVVLGGADYLSIAPPHSYIDTAWFENPGDLAVYLLHLDAHEEDYARYFDWKRYYSVEAGVEQMARHGFCDLCAKLNDIEAEPKWYSSLVPQWSVETQCL